MESQNILPDDLVTVIYLPDAAYTRDVRPGAVGTAIRLVHLPNSLYPECRYWEVSFPTGTVAINERVLRKIDGEGRKVGRWDYCVFNAPKFLKEQRLELLEQLRGE